MTSGDIYAGVPENWPVCVRFNWSESSFERAIPKSRTFTKRESSLRFSKRTFSVSGPGVRSPARGPLRGIQRFDPPREGLQAYSTVATDQDDPEGYALQVFHRNVEEVVLGGSKIEDGYGMRTLELTGGLGLDQEALSDLGTMAPGGPQDLIATFRSTDF